MEDRIALSLTTTSAALQQAIDKHRNHIADETLTVQWADVSDGARADVQVDGNTLQIGLRKV